MTAPAGTTRQHFDVTFATLAIACTTYSLLQTMVTPALATFQHELHSSATWTTWVVTAFLLSASITTPIVGRLGDQYGKRRLLLVSLGIFLVGCVGAAAAWNIWSLIFFRVLQGTAGALFPLGYAVIRDEFPAEMISSRIAFLSSLWGVGGGGGLVLSGLIVDNLSWRWLFITTAASGVVSLVLVLRYVPESPIKTETRVDVPGAVLFALGMGAVLVGLSEGEHWGWSSPRVLALFAAGAAVLAAWIVVERRVDEPMIDVELLRRRPILLTNLCAFALGVSMAASWVFLAIFVETPRGMGETAARVADYGFGLSATKTGLLLLPYPLMMVVVGAQVGRIGRRFGMKLPLSVGCLVFALATGGFVVWNDRTWQILVLQILLGVGVALAMGALPALVTEAARQSETAVANGINVVLRTVGMVVGAQVGAVFLTAYTIGATTVPSLTGYRITFAIGAVAGLVASLLAAYVTPNRRGRRQELALAGAPGGRR
jgi:EmrB/QacA subfamily drug resistance transporter